VNVCVVIPAHNEAQAIALLVQAVKAKQADLVVINDGSTDGTGRLAADNGAVVLTNDVKSGKGRSLQRGFEYALKKGYDGVITMDGDGQHAPEDLDQFLLQIQKDPHSIVTGNRMANPSGMPWVRWCTNRFMSWLISLVCHQSVPDTQCGYRYICSDVLKSIQITSCDFEIETEVLIKASRMGCRIVSVPVQSIYRDEKSKINPLKDTARFFAYLTKECFCSSKSKHS